MKVNKRYLLLEVKERKIDDIVEIKLSTGEISGPYYSKEYLNELFNTEELAIEEAFRRNPYGRYTIIPEITFDN